MSEQIDYRAVRRRVEQGLQKQKTIARGVFFVVSLFMFILFLALAWSMFTSNGGVAPTASDFTNIPGVDRNTDPLTGAMIMLSVGWGTSLLFQFISLMLDTKVGEQSLRERLTGREIANEMMRLGLEDEEPREKRKHSMQLSDDGELESIVDEPATDEAIKRQRLS